MYRQIRVHQDDWDLQRILWRPSPNMPVSAYHLCTVTYGLASAPYLAIKTLRQLVADEGHRFPQAVDVIRLETYVDDVFSGGDTIEEATEKIQQVNDLLLAGGFPLQKWTASHEELLSNIPATRKESATSLSFEDEPLYRALGLSWQPQSDNFVFTSDTNSDSRVITKRAVLSRIARL